MNIVVNLNNVFKLESMNEMKLIEDIENNDLLEVNLLGNKVFYGR